MFCRPTPAGLTLIVMDTVGMWENVGFLANAFAVFKHVGISIDLVRLRSDSVPGFPHVVLTELRHRP